MHRTNEAGLVEVEIDNRRYEFQKFGASLALDILTKIARIASKPLGLLMGEAVSSGGNVSFTPDILGQVLVSLMQNLDNPESIALIKKLTSENILCDGKKINYDTHYQDKMFHSFKVLKASLEVQYGSFFDELLPMVGIEKAPALKTKIANRKAI